MRVVNESGLPVLTQKRLVRMGKKMTDRQIGAMYGVNQKYICNLRLHDIEPTGRTEKGQEVRYRMGLDRRPKPKAEKAPSTPYKLAWLRMMDETRAALRWKAKKLFTKKLHEGDQKI